MNRATSRIRPRASEQSVSSSAVDRCCSSVSKRSIGWLRRAGNVADQMVTPLNPSLALAASCGGLSNASSGARSAVRIPCSRIENSLFCTRKFPVLQRACGAGSAKIPRQIRDFTTSKRVVRGKRRQVSCETGNCSPGVGGVRSASGTVVAGRRDFGRKSAGYCLPAPVKRRGLG